MALEAKHAQHFDAAHTIITAAGLNTQTLSLSVQCIHFG